MLKKTVCRRCGRPIQVKRELDPYGKLRTVRFNLDGSPHWCEVKISVDYRLEWAKFNVYN